MVEETLDAVSGHLDDLWKLKGPIYSEQRMSHLLEIIGSEVAQLVQSLIMKVSPCQINIDSTYNLRFYRYHPTGE